MLPSSTDTEQRTVEQRSVERRVGPPHLRAAAATVPSRAAVRALRQFLTAQRDGWTLESRLTWAACSVASEARRCGLPAERMLVALKDTWWALDEVHKLQRIDARDWLGRLVTLSIRAYYEPRRSGGASTASGGGTGARTVA
jgi:hypothetical protein